MKNIILIIIISLSIFFTSLVNAEDTKQESMIMVDDIVKDYALKTIKPIIEKQTNDNLLDKLLLIVTILSDTKTGISVSNIKPNDFMNLSMKSLKQVIDEKNDLLNSIPIDKRETVRVLHNKYMIKDPSGIFFAPSASDIIKYRFAFGCSHYARVFMAIVKSLDLIKNPEDMRYVIACNSEDYNKNFSEKNQKNTINGHQFVIVKIKNKQYAINTNYLSDYIEFPDGFTTEIDFTRTNIPVIFKKIKDKIFLIRKIGNNYYDDCADNSIVNLMNIYRSGKTDSSLFAWDKFFMQNNLITN